MVNAKCSRCWLGCLLALVAGACLLYPAMAARSNPADVAAFRGKATVAARSLKPATTAAPCPAKAGYNATAGTGASLYTVYDAEVLKPEWVDNPEAACAAAGDDCQGFIERADGKGLLKTSLVLPPANTSSSGLAAAAPHDGICLYVKTTAVCTAKSGYSRLPDYDHAYDDISPTWSTDPAADCASYDSCAGFNLRPDRTGQAKTATLLRAFSSPGMCLYTKSAIACPAKPGYNVFVDVDRYGDDTSDVLSNPEAVCNKDASCTGFSMFSLNGQGTTKNVTSPIYVKPGNCLYVKTATICPGSPGYSRLVDHDHAWDDINKWIWIANPAAACTNTTACVGYNVHPVTKQGMIKTQTLNGTYYSHGYCLYTKAAIACPPQPGYRVYVDTDHQHDDLSDVLYDPLAACNTDPACQGFSMSSVTGAGTTKSATSPTFASAGNCLYAKTGTRS